LTDSTTYHIEYTHLDGRTELSPAMRKDVALAVLNAIGSKDGNRSRLVVRHAEQNAYTRETERAALAEAMSQATVRVYEQEEEEGIEHDWRPKL
jgi:hypothetical protein